jgi:hypothetical protein
VSKSVVLSVFATEAAADAAVESLKAWDKLSDDVKLSSIGVLVLDDKGKVKTHKVGSRSFQKGAGIGVIFAILLAPVTLIGGVVAGGVLGLLHHKGLGMSKEDREALVADLQGGKAAVGVLAQDDEAAAVAAKLTELGGATKTHAVSDEAMAEADTAAAAPAEDAPAAAAPEAAPEAPTEA